MSLASPYGRGAPDGAERARTVSFAASSPRGGAKEARKQYESKQEVRVRKEKF